MNTGCNSYSIGLGDSLKSRLLSPGRRKKKGGKIAAAEKTLRNQGKIVLNIQGSFRSNETSVFCCFLTPEIQNLQQAPG